MVSARKGFVFNSLTSGEAFVVSRFVFLSFVFLGWGFYELSGGSDFEPRQRIAEVTAAAPSVTQPEPAAAVPAPVTPEPAAAVPAPVTPEPPTRTAAAAPATVPITRRDLTALVTAPVPTPVTRAALAPSPVVTPQTAPPPAPTAILPAPPEPPEDLRQVTGRRVNMRGGPGTAYGVLATLTRGSQVIVLREPGNGWAKLRVVETGRVGWMSARLLAPVEPTR